MQDDNLPQNNSSSPSYVDDYQPPQSVASPSDDNQPFKAPPAPVSAAQDDSLRSDKPVSSVTEPIVKPVVKDNFKQEDKVNSNVVNDLSSNTQDTQSGSNQVVKNSPLEKNQSLETQNIFDLLGVSDGKEDEKEAFLNELQEVIWEDFIENDTALLLNEEQQGKLKEIQKKGETPEVQEEMLVYLDKLIPDLEDMMMDKAIELKEDMVLERISGMKEFYSSNQEALSKIGQAEELISQNKWADAGNLLNNIK